MLTAVLNGANEVDVQGTPDQGDPDGSGEANVRINPGQRKLCYALNWRDIGAVVAAHVHDAAAGTNGPIVIPLALDGRTGISTGCTTAERDLLVDIIKDPTGYYVNLHTGAFPTGAIRGQLAR
ncbi:MAG: CHRD domain-containing protein [Actinomycetota bacterium]|nr:CHRD domain-containing protein [Actinomycetota bacterium]MDQ3627704.1 CHRD domain-containing protein [Actinomycetota bacterium]